MLCTFAFIGEMLWMTSTRISNIYLNIFLWKKSVSENIYTKQVWKTHTALQRSFVRPALYMQVHNTLRIYIYICRAVSLSHNIQSHCALDAPRVSVLNSFSQSLSLSYSLLWPRCSWHPQLTVSLSAALEFSRITSNPEQSILCRSPPLLYI